MESRCIAFSDFYHYFKVQRKKTLATIFFFSLLALIFCLLQPLEYRAEGTFKEKGKSESGLSKSLMSQFFLIDQAGSDALVIMSSRSIMERLIQTLKLQAEIKEPSAFPLFERIKRQFVAEWVYFLGPKIPLLKDLKPDLFIKEIIYGGEIPLSYTLRVDSDKHYTLKDSKSKETIKGEFDQELLTKEFTLRVQAIADIGKKKGKTYQLTIFPLGQRALDFSKKLQVKEKRNEKGLLQLTFDSQDRFLAASVVTGIMKAYNDYITDEHKRLTSIQIDYLTKRQSEASRQLKAIIQESALEHSLDLSATGFVTSEKAMSYFAEHQYALKSKLFSIELDQERIMHIVKSDLKDEIDLGAFSSINVPAVILRLTEEINQLQHRKSAFELLIQNNAPSLKNFEPSLFQGVNINTANEMYVSYSKELSDKESQAIEKQFILEQMKDARYEITSLSAVLNDPISMDIISKTYQIASSLKDLENRSAKEQERLKADLAIQKSLLTSHLEDALQLLKQRGQFLREKIESLEHLNLTLIKEKISLLSAQLKKYLKDTLEHLSYEKSLLQKNLDQLKKEMANFPEKWAQEQLIEQQMEVNKGMVEEITKLVESKNIVNNLEKIQSLPLDLPIVPIHPKPPHLILFAMLGASFGALVSGCLGIKELMLRNNPTSFDNLALEGVHVSGKLSSHLESINSSHLLDSDLDTLRRMVGFFMSLPKEKRQKEGLTILLMKSHGPSYAEHLAWLLNTQGAKVLIIDCGEQEMQKRQDFKALPYFDGNIANIEIIREANIEQGCIDSINLQRYHRFTAEFLASNQFQEFLLQKNKEYDWVLVVTSIAPTSAGSECLLNAFKNVVVTITDQPCKEIEQWIQNASKRSVFATFVFCDGLKQ